MKLENLPVGQDVHGVTPFVGVWIETSETSTAYYASPVTPFVGVWIETSMTLRRIANLSVTPFVGVWIETVFGSSEPHLV